MKPLPQKITNKILDVPNIIKRAISKDKIQRHRQIFSINSGRSGSGYLAQILGTAQEVVSYHEPAPKMIGDYLEMITHKPYEKSLKKRKIKSMVIQNQLLSLQEGQIYSETSQMFIKTFFDVILEDFKHTNIEVIILRRNFAETVKSCLELGYFSLEKNKSWPLMMPIPNAVTAAIPCIGDIHTLDQYDLCIAYLLDIEARANRFQKDYPDIKTHQIFIEKCKDYDYIEKIFSQLRITPTQATQEIYGQKINTRTQKKLERQAKVDLAYCEQRIYQYIEKAESMGIVVPSLFKNYPIDRLIS